MVAFLALPFEMHVQITKFLTLRDCIALMQVCTTTHDVVHYVFAHRVCLDFLSILDSQNAIALSPSMLMTVLYAHSRAEFILNFRLHESFSCFDEFFRYFKLYWSYKQVNLDQFDDVTAAVGHPAGHLQEICYLGHQSGGSTPKQDRFLTRLWDTNQEWLGDSIHELDNAPTPYTDGPSNWSSIDVDAPYTWCLDCQGGRCTCSTPDHSGDELDTD